MSIEDSMGTAGMVGIAVVNIGFDIEDNKIADLYI